MIENGLREPAPAPGWSPIVEFRQYTLHPGMREVLIDLFEEHFIEGQEQYGMKVIGHFRDLDDPDKFTWLRGFQDMSERAKSLAGFYGGPIWRSNRDAANRTMIDSTDVLLLRPATRRSAFSLDDDRPPPGADSSLERGFVLATILHLEGPAAEAEVLPFFERVIAPTVLRGDGLILAYFVTDPSENNFPALPVREGEHVFMWFTGFADRRSLEHAARDEAGVRGSAAQAPGLQRPPQLLRLSPTSRSLLSGRSPVCPAISHA